MIINREKVADSFVTILTANLRVYGPGGLIGKDPTAAALDRTECPDCGYALSDDEEGCDTCHPVKQILHKGY